jgi:hypothetical protein
MTPNEYVKFALITESNQFSSQTILGKLSMKFFKWANAGTLSDRFTQRRNIRLIHSSIGIATEMEEVLSMLDNSLKWQIAFGTALSLWMSSKSTLIVW